MAAKTAMTMVARMVVSKGSKRVEKMVVVLAVTLVDAMVVTLDEMMAD